MNFHNTLNLESNNDTNNISNNTFIDNNAGYGGAIYSFNTKDNINNNNFKNNTATNDGGAILNSISSQTVSNNNFTKNNAKYGGAIYSVSGNQSIENNQFNNNTATDNSSSIYIEYSFITLINNTIPNNTIINKTDVEGNSNRTIYNTKDVVPANTTEKIYTMENNTNTYKTIFALNYGAQQYYSDDNTGFCIEPEALPPIYHTIFERELLTNQIRYNQVTNENVIEYIKGFLVLFWNDTESFDDPTDLTIYQEGINFLIKNDFHNTTKLSETLPGFKHPQQYYITKIEDALKNSKIPNSGLLRDNKTTYQIYYYKALDEYNSGTHYQNMIGISINKTPLNMSWAWKLVNETTNKTYTVNYTVNVTVKEPYNETEEYQENITVEEPYNVTETYTVNVSIQEPYNRTETYNVNVTTQEPYNVTEQYTVNVTKQKPYITTRENTRTKNINKGIEKNTKTNNLYNKNNNKSRNVTIQETRTRTVTKYRNVTTQETRTRTVTEYRNVTTQEIKNITVTKYRNVTKTVTRTRIVTKYRPVTHEEQRSQTITQISYHYKLYIYLLYLEGKISYNDLVAIIGSENIQFNENGSIVLDFENIEDIPDNISVTGLNNTAIPTTSDDIDASNPDGLENPVMDAGIITTEI